MPGLDHDLTAASLPARLFWIPLLALDLILLVFLAEAHTMAGLLVLAGAALLLIGHPPAALALGAAGMPLFQPLNRATGELRWSFLLGLAILSAPALPLAWSALWSGAAARRVRDALASPVLLSALALGLVLFLGLQWTPSPLYGSDKAQLYLLVNLVLLMAALVYLRRDRPGVPRAAPLFLRAIVWLQIGIALAAVWNYETHFYMWWGRLKTLGMNPIWTARHAGLGILCLVGLVSMKRARWVTAVPALLLLGWVFTMAASRGPTLALAVALGFWAFHAPLGEWESGRRPVGRRQVGRRLARAAPAILVLVLAALPGLLRQGETASRELSNQVRLRLLEAAREALGGVSFFGLGTGGFTHLLGLPDQRFYPHNIFVEVLLENGVLGAAFLILFFVLVYRGWRRWGAELQAAGEVGPEQALWRVSGAVFVYAVLNAQFSGDIWVNEWIWLWAGAIAAWSPRGRGRRGSPAPL